jgi:hypothetical protein
MIGDTMASNAFRAALILVVVLTSSCASNRRIIGMEPTITDGAWRDGRRIVNVEGDGIRLAATALNQGYREFHFQVEIANDTDREFVVGPELFTGVAVDVEGAPIPRTESVLAVDPEVRLQRTSAAAGEMTAVTCTDALDATVSLLDAIAGLADGREVAEELEARERAEVEDEELESQKRRRWNELNDARYFWSETALRKTTLRPGQSAGGVVVMKSCGNCAGFVLRFELEGDVLEVPFRLIRAVPAHLRDAGDSSEFASP